MRGNRKTLLVVTSAVALSGLAGVAHASLVASDQVTNNPPYNNYVNPNGLNGGSGFGPWSATNVAGTSGGAFTWPTDLTTPGSGQGFDIYDNGTQGGGTIADEFAAIRPSPARLPRVRVSLSKSR